MIMTQEQLVKELRDGPPVHTHPGDPELRLTPRSAIFVRDIMATAANLIETLAADRASAMQDASDFLKELNELQSRIPRWISVEERLPDTRDWVLVIGEFVPEGGWFVPQIAEYFLDSWRLDVDECSSPEDRGIRVTNWMPLPEPPKEYL